MTILNSTSIKINYIRVIIMSIFLLKFISLHINIAIKWEQLLYRHLLYLREFCIYCNLSFNAQQILSSTRRFIRYKIKCRDQTIKMIQIRHLLHNLSQLNRLDEMFGKVAVDNLLIFEVSTNSSGSDLPTYISTHGVRSNLT